MNELKNEIHGHVGMVLFLFFWSSWNPFFGLVCQVIVLFLFGFVIYILIAVFDNCFCLCHFYLFLSLA